MILKKYRALGTRVYLRQDHPYSRSVHNPIGVFGTVIELGNKTTTPVRVRVEWDNGVLNSYTWEDLDLDPDWLDIQETKLGELL